MLENPGGPRIDNSKRNIKVTKKIKWLEINNGTRMRQKGNVYVNGIDE